MKFRGEFKVENLHHFVGCLMSLSKLAVEQTESMNALLRITKSKISVITKTMLYSDAFLEIDTDELFHSPYILEGNEYDTIALNLSVNSLYETLNAAVNSEHAALKLKRHNQVTALSVTFPDPALPSISITLDILISPTDEYLQKESVLPEIPPCTCNIGITKFQSIICYLESANKIGNELTEFEVCQDCSPQAAHLDAVQQITCTERRNKVLANNERTFVAAITKPNAAKSIMAIEARESGHQSILLKVKSPGIMAELETTFHGLQSFPSYGDGDMRNSIYKNPKTVLRTEAVYNLFKHAIDTIIFSKHEALLVAAIPDDYETAEWTFFILSVTSLESCQMVFMIPNYVPAE
ncbi:uncharacterized protein BXIN_0950 [Babesia sp. Xinjiang]|uniref:uncharacterized protein n=1 Tax=Babesia sp. Xinjiang TaxID=462227 RepID=UPI000A2661CE|nr:uncharacterized protein BXIN_0950 [Babesia sp. Xinjiang]ORM42082.1 hypothetical protein BXIN_0950 [Babesia sp. Xinjiang]